MSSERLCHLRMCSDSSLLFQLLQANRVMFYMDRLRAAARLVLVATWCGVVDDCWRLWAHDYTMRWRHVIQPLSNLGPAFLLMCSRCRSASGIMPHHVISNHPQPGNIQVSRNPHRPAREFCSGGTLAYQEKSQVSLLQLVERPFILLSVLQV